jgi:hypothetical protein
MTSFAGRPAPAVAEMFILIESGSPVLELIHLRFGDGLGCPSPNRKYRDRAHGITADGGRVDDDHKVRRDRPVETRDHLPRRVDPQPISGALSRRRLQAPEGRARGARTAPALGRRRKRAAAPAGPDPDERLCRQCDRGTRGPVAPLSREELSDAKRTRRVRAIALMTSTAGPFLRSESLLRLPHLSRDASSRERFIERLC